MLITDEIFQAFLQCETKSHLKLSGATGDQRAFPIGNATLSRITSGNATGNCALLFEKPSA